MAKEINPSLDAGLGLVFRMNNNWNLADGYARNGNYDQWNNVLEVIYRNLSYRNSMEDIKDEDGNLIDIELSLKDRKTHEMLSSKIAKYKRGWLKARGTYNKEGLYKGVPMKQIYRGLWYKAIAKKDVWLRKKMFELKLYLKETTKDTGSSVFGGFGR